MKRKFYSQYIRPEKQSYDNLSLQENDMHDSLCPMSVAEQVLRFTHSGEVFQATRRRELMSLRGLDIDDPDSVRSSLDKEHITPADLKDSQDELARKIKNSKTNKNKVVGQVVEQAVERQELSPSATKSTEQSEHLYSGDCDGDKVDRT